MLTLCNVKLLVIQPQKCGHRSFDRALLLCLGRLGELTFVAPTSHLEDVEVHTRIAIPDRIFERKGKLASRVAGMKALRFCERSVDRSDYDVVVFLSYESISLALFWDCDEHTYLINHNNLDSVDGSFIKKWLYGFIGTKCKHLVFQEHIASYLHDEFSAKSVVIPHPYYHEAYKCGLCMDPVSDRSRATLPVIFSPSSSTPKSVQVALKEFVASERSAYAILKESSRENNSNWRSESFFDDYEDVMHSSEYVLVAAAFTLRVSGVAYEALSYGKRVIMFDSQFARALAEAYPAMIMIVESSADFAGVLRRPMACARSDYLRYLSEHSSESITNALRHCFSSNVGEEIGENQF